MEHASGKRIAKHADLSSGQSRKPRKASSGMAKPKLGSSNTSNINDLVALKGLHLEELPRGAMVLLAERALIDLVSNPECPANTRAVAARTILELAGRIGSGRTDFAAGGALEATEMTIDDIDREIARLTKTRDLI